MAAFTLLLLLLGSFPLGAVLTTPCPEGWIFRPQDSACYNYKPDRSLDWSSARDFCRNTEGGDLVSVENEAEYNFLKDNVITSQSLYLTWIGLGSNKDRWSNGDAVNFTKWTSTSEPSNDPNLCVGWRTQSVPAKDGWKSVNCRYSQPFVCKQHSIGCPKTVQKGMNGTIESSNFPNNYDNDLFCTYEITAPEDYRIVLKFNFFETQYLRDFVSIFDGADSDAMLMGKMFGNVPEKSDYASSDNALTVVFQTNPTVTATGWSASWNAVPIKDPINVSGTGGELTTPNYPHAYPNDIDQVYHITANSGALEITVNDFVTEQEFDFLLIFDGPKLTGKPLARLSGTLTNQLPLTYTTTKPSASLRFVSDAQNDGPVKGWNITWTAVPL